MPVVPDYSDMNYEVIREITAILVSGGDFDASLNRVLQTALKAVGASSGSIMLLEESGEEDRTMGSLVIRSAVGLDDSIVRNTRHKVGEGISGWVAKNRKPLLLFGRPDNPEFVSSKENNTPSASMVAPLLARDRVIGVISLNDRKNGERFSQGDLDFLMTVSSEIGLALENSALFAETLKTKKTLEAVLSATAEINSARGIKYLLEKIMNAVEKIIESESGSIFIFNREKTKLEFALATGPAGGAIKDMKIDAGEGLAGWAAKTGRGIIVNEAYSDPRFSRSVDEVSGYKTRNIMAVPLLVNNETLGIIEVLNKKDGRLFSRKDLSMLEIFAAEAAIAMSNSFLYEKLEQRARELNGELVTANERLLVEKDRVECVIQSIANGIIAVSSDFKILFVNGLMLEFIGVPKNEIMDKDIRILPYLKHIVKAIERSEERNETVYEEITLKDNKEKNYAFIVTPMGTKDRGLMGYAGILHDVTQYKEKDRKRMEMLHNVTHELKAPMTSIRAFTDLINYEIPAGGKPAEWINLIKDELDRLGKLIKDFLSLSAIESGQDIVLSISKSSMEDTVREVMKSMSVDGKHTLNLEADKNLPQAEFDRDKIKQVVYNLIVNAFSYSPAGGRVDLKVFSEGGFLKFSVRDRGIGISAYDLPKIFERFHRSEEASRVNPAGSGVGLAIVKRIMDMHRGKIDVTSIPGQGSTFIISLPTIDEGLPKA